MSDDTARDTVIKLIGNLFLVNAELMETAKTLAKENEKLKAELAEFQSKAAKRNGWAARAPTESPSTPI